MRSQVALAAGFLAITAFAPAQSYEVVHAFGVSGGTLVARLLPTADGRLMGVARDGGFFTYGSIFALTPDGLGGYSYSELHAFSGPDGLMPVSALVQAAGGDFYGTTSLGGTFGFGTAFSVDGAGHITTLHHFSGAVDDGATPLAALLQGADGYFYGTASQGGALGSGCVFRMDAAGVVTVLHSFEGAGGAAPAGELIRALDGNFYGTTLVGGDNGVGVVFRIDTTGNFTVVANLDDTSGGSPIGGLVEAHPGDFFGVASAQGANKSGTVFRVSAAGDLSAVHSFAVADGDRPSSTLLLAGDGMLYGTAAAGGQSSNGTVFRIDPDTEGFESIHSFDSSEGQYPEAGLVPLPDGRLAGALKTGGPMPYGAAGAVYAIDDVGIVSVLHTMVVEGGAFPDAGLIQAQDGYLYGTTGTGGATGAGTVFKVSMGGDLTVLHSFVEGVDGVQPSARLFEASNGSFYGVTDFRGSPSGNIFKMSAAGDLEQIHLFGGADGAYPQAGFVAGPGGYLYSTTETGGTGSGTVYRTDLAGVIETLHSFGGADGESPAASLLLASDGDFYGTTKGLTGAFGSVFRMDTSFDVTTLHAFQESDGIGPGAELIEPVAGVLYGTTLAGGVGGVGTVFRMDLSGQITTLHEFSGPDGDQPRAGLVQGGDGLFYGTTIAGGANGSGTLFKISSDGTFTTLHDFDTASGASPIDTLVLASDGNLYGVAGGGGVNGVIFRWLSTASEATLVSIVPTSGRAAGGTSVTIFGSHLKPGSTLTLGGSAVTGQIEVDMRTILAITPALPPGSVSDVTLSGGAGPTGAFAVLQNGWFADFLDVPSPYLFHDFIESIVRAGITAGCGGGNYCPGSAVTRAQMAVFLLKAEHGSAYAPPPCTGVFPDVPCPSAFGDWIERLAAEGITSGCGGGNYCPGAAVTRAQMAVFLLKTLLGPAYVPPPAAGIFGDVPIGSFAADWIEDLYGRSITGGCSAAPPLYCPNNPNTRGQMAVFLVRTFGL